MDEPQINSTTREGKMKERPKVGDCVEFRSQGLRTGTVIAVAETGVHFLIETPFTTRRKPWEREFNLKHSQVPLSAIIRILPNACSPHKPSW